MGSKEKKFSAWSTCDLKIPEAGRIVYHFLNVVQMSDEINIVV